MPPVTPRTMRLPASALDMRRLGSGNGGQASESPTGNPSPAASAIACASASGSNSGSTGASVHTILCWAISSKPIESGLRDTDDTCGGIMCPRPSPSWLKYELMLRARRAARVTRENFESTVPSRRSIGGLIIVSWSMAIVPDSLPAAGRFDDRQHLVDGRVEIVVDHHPVGEFTPDRLFHLGLLQARQHLVVGVATPTQPSFLFVARRREHEDQQGVGIQALHLLGTVDLDLEDDVERVAGFRGRTAVVVAEELGPLEKSALLDPALEAGRVGEDVGVVRLGRALFASGPRTAEPQVRVALDEPLDDGSLADPTRPGDDDDHAASAELIEQFQLLLCAEALHPTVVGDLDVFHDLASLDLAHAGQRLEQRHDLELADVRVVGRERLGQAHRAHLQTSLDLGTGGTSFGRLGQSSSALLGGQRRRCCHAVTLARRSHRCRECPAHASTRPTRAAHPRWPTGWRTRRYRPAPLTPRRGAARRRPTPPPRLPPR